MALTGYDVAAQVDTRMVNSAAAFAKQLNKLGAYVKGDVNKVIRKTALDLFSAIVQSTPVDTRRAASNWEIDTEERDGVRESFDRPGFSSGSPVKINLNEIPLNFNVDRNARLVIYNNVEYITFLESGSSTQAPNGMVAKNLKRFEVFLRKNANNLRSFKR